MRASSVFFLSLVLLAAGVVMSPLAAETLSVANLAQNERIIIVYSRTEGARYVERLYEIKRRGPETFFGAVERKTSVGGKTINPTPNRTIGATYLTGEEITGLDAYLIYLRHGASGACSTVELFTIGYYRADQKIGEERFRDETCRTLGFHRLDGKIVPAEERNAPEDFPPTLFRAIVPPRLVEERIAEEATAMSRAAD